MGSVHPVSAMMATHQMGMDAAVSALLSKTSDVREEVKAKQMCANLSHIFQSTVLLCFKTLILYRFSSILLFNLRSYP